ncbi:MAG: hypothetical protein A2289_18710 [Deltaproteobacteria bacterium RIFOXYA12_FULL_58_15]|nr:MAG: hypothetical protein A2289_18710 [Deltaproteobacteria bacterium RIFOXYA12_FULL_58_15]OGR14139.1 MAG: hypothetical protein A2341_15795 [Deltaproteobacteria bacterium RIFOXYB12_FULL_58_9]
MKIEFTGLTDVGRKRNHNEDNFATDENLGLFVMCDGMGGHAAGEVASKIAVDRIHAVISKNRHIVDALKEKDTSELRTAVVGLIEKAVEDACAAVYDVAQADSAKAGMGTTLEMVLLVDHIGIMGHVGDSRLYMKRADRTYQLSEDHSLVHEMVRAGKMTETEAHRSPMNNVITRAVGLQSSVKVDTLVFDVLPGDTLLLCSDGLSDYVADEEELGTLLADDKEPLDKLAQRLIRFANERGGKDNITAVLIRSLPDANDSPRVQDVELRIRTLKRVRLFKHLKYKEVVGLLNLTQMRVLESDTALITEGGRDNDFFVVLDGRVRITRDGHYLADLGPGDHIGEMELVTGRRRSATVTTLGKTSVLAIRRSDFIDLLKANEHLALKLLWSLAQTLSSRLDYANAQLSVAMEAQPEDPAPPFA